MALFLPFLAHCASQKAQQATAEYQNDLQFVQNGTNCYKITQSPTLSFNSMTLHIILCMYIESQMMKKQLFPQYKIVAEYFLFPNHLPFFVAFKSGNNLTTRTDQTVHKGHQSLFVCHCSINELRDMINCCEILVIDLVQIYIFEFQLMLKSVSRKKYCICIAFCVRLALVQSS